MTSFDIINSFDNELVHGEEHQGCLLAVDCHKSQCGIFQCGFASVKFLV